MIIHIKTVPNRETATKMNEWRDDKTGKPLNKSKAPRCNDVYCPLYSRKIGGLNTGELLDYVENPHYVDVKKLEAEKKTKEEIFNIIQSAKSKLGKNWDYLTDKSEITRQELLEKKHGKDPGFYTNVNYVKTGNPQIDRNRTFMQSFRIPLFDGTTILDTANPIDELKYHILKKHPRVCASLQEVYTHVKPKATHYISLEDEDVEMRLKESRARNKAIARLEDDDFIDDNKLLILKALSWNNRQYTLRGKDMYDMLSSKLTEREKYKATDPQSNVAKFNKMYDLLKDEGGRQELSARGFLQDALDTRVIVNNKETYTWVSRGMVIGNRKEGEDSAIEYLMDPTKAKNEHKTIRAEINARQIT